MATTDEIRSLLQTQATQRINPFMRGLSLLTGGLAGEFTGTNEDIRNRELAKRALMEQNIKDLEEERLAQRMEAERKQRLEDEVKRLAAQRESDLLTGTAKARGAAMALSGTAKNFIGPLDAATQAGIAEAELAQAKVQAERMNALKGRETEMRGYLAGRNVQLGEPDVETVAFLEAQEKAKQEVQKEARQAKLDEGRVFVSRNAAGEVAVQGPADLVRKYQEANPDLFSKVKGSPYKISMRQTEDGSSFNVDFGEMTVGQVEELAPQIDKMRKAYGASLKDDLSGAGGEGTKEFPKGPAAEKGAAQVKRRTGETRSGAADAVVSEIAAPTVANMYGPLSPSEQFTKTGRQLKALEGRGGAYTYGASQTLTDPFYESVASELGTKPQRIGQESVLVRGAKSVIANEFPTEQWNSLPQEVKNRIYIEALNKSAAEMAKPQTSRGYNRSPFADISYQRD